MDFFGFRSKFAWHLDKRAGVVAVPYEYVAKLNSMIPGQSSRCVLLRLSSDGVATTADPSHTNTHPSR